MNIGAHPVRLCALLLFCFGLQISELLPTLRTVATDRVGDQFLRVPANRAGTEELLTDDGAAEILIRFENVSVSCVNRLKPTLYPATLQTIRIFFFPFPSNPAGAQIRLIAFESGQSQIQPPPNPTLLVDQTVTIPSLPPLGGFIDFPIQNGPTINSGDFYVGFQAPNPPGAVTFSGDTGQPQNRSFVSFDNGRDFRLLSAIPGLPPLNLMIRAIVANNAGAAPRIEAPPALSFDYVRPGDTSERSLTVRNTGDAPLSISDVTSSDPQFTLAPLTLPLTIEAGGQSVIKALFKPTGIGSKTAALTILSDDPARPSLNIALSGIGEQLPFGGTVFVNSGVEQTGSILEGRPGVIVVYRTEYAIFVPQGATELKIDLSGNQNLDLFVRFDNRVFPPGGGGVNPDHRSSNPGLMPESISITPSTSPPLRSGLYYIAILNLGPGPGAADFTLKATVTGGVTPGAASIVSAASFSGPDLSSDAIAAAFGSGLATSMKSASAIPLPTELDGTTIKVRDNAGTERLAPLFYVAPDQANFQIPPGTASGAAFLTFTGGDGKISTGVAQIASVAPAIFAANADGRGPAVAFAVRARADGSRINESMLRLDPALNRLVLVPISLGAESDQVFVILFGTGIRGVNSLSAVSATIGGVPVMVGFAGAQTEFVGVDQVNIGPLPRNLAGRGEVDVVITVEGKVANTVKIAVE